jgi:hypothetical protein
VVLREVVEAAAALRGAENGFGVKMGKRAEEVLGALEVRVEGGKVWGVYRNAEGQGASGAIYG